MTAAAMMGTALVGTEARSKRLSIGGVDMLTQYAGSAYSYYTKQDTIEVNEEGPGGVSSLSFTIADPRNEVVLSLGTDIEFWDIARDRPIFRGWIQSLTIIPTATGRELMTECVGIEAMLDWMVIPPCTIPAGTWLAAGIQSLYYQATGIGWPLRAFTQPSGSEDYGSQEYPIAGIFPHFPSTQYDVSFEGQSFREAAQILMDSCNTWADGTGGGYLTIDFYSGLRYLNGNGPGSTGILTMSAQSDMDPFVIEDVYPNTTGARTAAAAITFELDQGAVQRGVYIKGANAAGSGLVADGSGIVGPIAYLPDDTSTTASIRNTIARAYLAGQSQSVRATAEFHPISKTLIDTYDYRPGSYLYVIADSQLLAAQALFSLFSIRKTYPGAGQEDWVITFGGFAPRDTRATRRMTRSTRS